MIPYVHQYPIPTDWVDFEGTEPGQHMLTMIRLGSLSMHVEAIRIDPDIDATGHDTGWQGSKNAQLDEKLNTLANLVDANEPFQTTQIPGFTGEYVIIFYPHCD